jgi:membrane-bound lytic murein transglycosylase D
MNKNILQKIRCIGLAGSAILVAACAQLPPAEQDAAEGGAFAGDRTLAAPPQPAVPLLPEPQEEPPAKPAKPLPAGKSEIAPTPPRNLWDRIRTGFAMREIDNALVREWEAWYSTRPDYVARMVERSRRVLFHVVEEVERRKMPAEIALLPMIESAYNPQAYSRAHASGMWQFIPSTGKLYGLRQDWWYDGRRDIVAATTAALDYLEKLYGMFGDWELALASYNWGEGAVSRAIAKNQAKGLPADYENLDMPAETRNYLPKLQAVKNIVSDPARFGLTLAEIANEPYFATITTPRHIDVKLAAQLAEIPIEEFRFLNPAHNRPVINANAAETIVLPRDKVEVFQRNLEKHTKPLVSWQAHTVKPGETAAKIAARHGITVEKLKEINGITGRSGIRTGQALLVPVKAGAEPHLPDLPAPALAVSRTVQTRYVPRSHRGPAVQQAVRHDAKAAKKKALAKAPAKAVKTKSTARAKPPAPPPSRKVIVAENP